MFCSCQNTISFHWDPSITYYVKTSNETDVNFIYEIENPAFDGGMLYFQVLPPTGIGDDIILCNLTTSQIILKGQFKNSIKNCNLQIGKSYQLLLTYDANMSQTEQIASKLVLFTVIIFVLVCFLITGNRFQSPTLPPKKSCKN